MGSFVWDNHESVVLGRVQNLLKKSSFLDCTLAAEGQYLNAHKLILASSSPYFELLFSQERERNPIVILKDVKFEELKAIIDFMYRGKAEIPACQVNSFLKTAESLQVLGLIDPTKKKDPRENESAGLVLSSEGSNSILCEPKTLGNKVSSVSETTPNVNGSVRSDVIPASMCNPPRSSLPNHPVTSEISNDRIPVNGTLSHQNESGNITLTSPSVSHERENIEINEIEVANTLMKCDSDFRDTLKSIVGRQFVSNVPQNNENSPESPSDCLLRHPSHIIRDTSQVIPVMQDRDEMRRPEAITPQDPLCLSNTGNLSSISSDMSNINRSTIKGIDKSNNQPKKIGYAPFNFSPVRLGSHQDLNSGSQVESKKYSDELSSMPLDRCVTIKDEPDDFASDGNIDENDCNMETNLMEDDRLSWNNSNLCNQLSTNKCIVSASVPGVSSNSTAHNYYQQHQDIIINGSNNEPHRGKQETSQNTSLGKKIYTCPYCKKDFQWISTLEIHVRTHTGEKPFWCSFCDAKFARKDYLKSHVVSHSGEKRYGCLECGKRFTQKHNLTYHQTSHTGVKPFECYSCGRRFSQKRTLNNHLLSHISE